MSTASLHDSVLKLSGVMDYRSANAVLAKARQLLSGYQGAELTIDCQAVEKSSSVGVAVLLALLSDARSKGWAVSLTNLPQDMRQIAQVCELEPVLAL